MRYTFAGMRSDGCMPDRVQINGDSVMAPGGELPGNARNPGHDHAWDNGPFAALLLASTVTAWPDKALFCELEPEFLKASRGNRSRCWLRRSSSATTCTA